MAAIARQYRSYAEFEREEIFRPEAFAQTLEDFHSSGSGGEEELNLFDKPDADEDAEEEEEDDDE